jgi:hypothetical protein
VPVYRRSVTGSPVRTVFQRYLGPLIAALFLLSLTAPSARAQVVYDSGGFTAAAWSDMTTFALADNFTSAGSISFNAIRFWASSPGRGSTLSTFSGTLSYFIRASFGALPGNVVPSAVIASGTVSGAAITQTDTGVLNGAGDASHIIQLDFAIPQVNLLGGTYWLQLKEGTIDSPEDGSPLFWQSNTSPTIFPQTRADSDEVNPTLWNHIPGGNQAFQLRNTTASAAAPEPTSLALVLAGSIPLWRGLRRRK